MSEMKDAGVLLRLIYQAMVKAGVDVGTLMQKLGINEDLLRSTELRTPHEAQVMFWKLLESQIGDPDVGLTLGQYLPVYKGQVLEYLFLSSPNFGEGLKRVLNYQRLISDAADSALVINEHECYMRVNTASPNVQQIRHFNECFALGLLAFFKSITDGQFKPLRFDFQHSAPDSESKVREVMGCDVAFDCQENRLYFDRSMLDIPSLHAEPELLTLHEQLASEQVARLEREDVVGQVTRIVAELLERGNVTLEAVAERLGIKTRSLRTRLTEANTSFNQILADFRFRLSRRLLAGTDESIDEIVYLTGFSEPSTFYRAFKRWSGMTPVEYRKSKQNKE
ncbi:MAG: AraC family transcriptional regulator [Hahellaceae bacterium]|nr:AraC family transcriptional regulator [Hahellaceae bacterium]